MSELHKHRWVIDHLDYHEGDVVVTHWKCECGMKKDTREHLVK